MRSIDEIFHSRTCYKFSNKKVEHSILKEIYNLMKLAPTSANTMPLRIYFVESKSSKDKLVKCLMSGNIDKVISAPVTAIFAYDIKFYLNIPKLFPHNKTMQETFSSSQQMVNDTATRNAVLQAGYFMTIARGFGLDTGPMSGFDKEQVNKHFFDNTSYKADFLCNIGYKAEDNSMPRLPRLDFDEACKII